MRQIVIALAALGLMSAGVLVRTAGGPEPVRRAIPIPGRHLVEAYPAVAAAAYGRRVLIVHDVPLNAPTAEIVESARMPGGWALHPATPPGETALASGLARLAADAAAAWDADATLTEALVRDLARGCVAVVLIENGKEVVSAPALAAVPGLSALAGTRVYRVAGAEPVYRDGGDEKGPHGVRPYLSPAAHLQYEDSLWGGSLTIDADASGDYVLPWPVEGADVRVGGAPVTPATLRAELPYIVLSLDSGRHDVVVAYVEDGARGRFAIGGALGLAIAVVGLLLALRPDPNAEEADPNADIDDGSPLEEDRT